MKALHYYTIFIRMKFQSWKRPSKQRLGVVQASQEASAKRQAQIKEAESFLRWSRGFSTSKLKRRCNLSFSGFSECCHYHSCFLVWFFFFKVPSNQDCLQSHQLPLLQAKRLQKNPQRDLWPGHAVVGKRTTTIGFETTTIGGRKARWSSEFVSFLTWWILPCPMSC